MSKRVLIIEDNPHITEILEIRLKSHGFEVLKAHDGVLGLDMAKARHPQLVILDIELPGLNGFTICGLLKGNEEYRHIPIIMLTARRGDRDRVFHEDFKPDAFLTKPFDAKELMAKIEHLLGKT